MPNLFLLVLPLEGSPVSEVLIWQPAAPSLQIVLNFITALSCFLAAVILLWRLPRGTLGVESSSQTETELDQPVVADRDLQIAHHNLESCVRERTKDLETANKVLLEKTKMLERFNRVTQDRELEMIRLKNEIDGLLDAIGEPRRYHAPQQSLTKLRIGESA